VDADGSNRLFIILALALIGLICIGMVGVVGFLVLSGPFPGVPFLGGQPPDDVVTAPPTPTPFAPTFTPTLAPTSTPTDTPEPTPISTPVVGSTDVAAQPAETPITDPDVTATNTRVVRTPTPATNAPTPTPLAQEIPASGGVLSQANNNFLLWAGGGLLLVILIYGGLNHFRALAQGGQEE
jgi:hypothetical protein